MMSDSEAFNKSSRVARSPPLPVNETGNKDKFMTNDDGIPCNRCEISDKRIKLRCGKCRRWWHPKCAVGKEGLPQTEQVQAGKWQCKQCRTPPPPYVEDESIDIRVPLTKGDAAADSTHIPVTGVVQPKVATGAVPKQKSSKTEQKVTNPTSQKNDVNKPPPKIVSKNKDNIPGPNPVPNPNPELIPPVTFNKGIVQNFSSLEGNPTKLARQEKDRGTEKSESRPPSKYASSTRSRRSNLEEANEMEEEFALELAKIEADNERRMLEMKLNQVKRRQEVLHKTNTSRSHESAASASSHESSGLDDWFRTSENQRQQRNRARRSVELRARTATDTASRHTVLPRVEQFARSTRNVSCYNPNTTATAFVNDILQTNGADDYKLTSNQIRARSVMERNLPEFDGEPCDWPNFIARYTESTRRCGYTNVENLDRLSRCLKGRAYMTVRAELNKRNGLTSVLSTLRLLYGRPEIVYTALINGIQEQPSITEDTLERIIPFASSIKTLCEALEMAEMEEYKFSRLLRLDLLAKLPSSLRMAWGNHEMEKENSGEPITIEEFSSWLNKQAEVYARTHKPTRKATKAVNRSRKSDQFLGTHVTPETPPTNTTRWKGYCHYCQTPGHITYKCPELMKMTVDERWEKVRERRLCISCLGKHLLRHCGSDSQCGVNGCTRPHHRILHGASSRPSKKSVDVSTHALISESENGSESETPQAGKEGITRRLNTHFNNGLVKFQVLPVVISNGFDREERTYAFLDTGSEVTLMSNKLANRLNLRGVKDKMKLKWSNQTTHEEVNSRRVSPTISDIRKEQSFCLKDVRTVDSLQLPTQTLSLSAISDYTHLKDVPVEEYADAIPEILIGSDHFQFLVPQQVIQREWHEPVAIQTRLGWTIVGNGQTADSLAEISVNCQKVTNEDLKEAVDKYFALENIGIRHPKSEVESIADKQARSMMEANVKQREDGRYESGLLWKDKDVQLPDSLLMAVSRLRQLERKNEKRGQQEIVNKIIKEYHECGYLVELTDEQRKQTTRKTWYLPLFTVENPNKPGKVRLVWDAAARVQGTSLNDNLLTGPDLTANLVYVLYKFREHKVAVGGDIEAMFHQIVVSEDDQDSQRCLWRHSRNDKIHVSRMTVMTFGAACSPSLAQYIKNKNAEKFDDEFPRAAQAVKERHYVDDYLDSFTTYEEAIGTMDNVIHIHKEGGFNLRGVVSNDERVTNKFRGESERKLLTQEGGEKVKMLGMWWEIKEDVLRYELNQDRMGLANLLDTKPPTKRQVLRALMMVFDPLGLIGYIILKGKLVLKGIWRHPLDWDDEIPEAENIKWKAWVNDLTRVTSIKINRWYFTSEDQVQYDLHVFVDAGEDAAAAVCYVTKTSRNAKEVALVGSKTKVGPNKPTSIPRLELQAAVIGARLATTVKEGHSIPMQSTTYWTDSRNVLCWIRSPRRFKVFVAHRIGEIRETTSVKEWRYVPTGLNPADFGTKWMTLPTPMPSLWLHGPEYLRENEDRWPEEPANLPPIEDEVLELRCNVKLAHNNSLLPDVNRFSSYTKLIRTQAYVLRFFAWGKTEDKSIRMNLSSPLSPEEIEDAERYVIREIQREEFQDEVQTLLRNEQLTKGNKLKQYSPFIDGTGIVRMKSRLQEAEYLTFDQRCPVILPKDHPVTTLIINRYHVKYLHQNHATVLNELKQRYVIPSIRATLKKIRRACWMCKRRALQPEAPEMCPLPRSRLAVKIRPFSYTGVDYFGPVLVRTGRRTEKNWGALFTCLTTRAIHIELAGSLSSDSFILVLRRFMARRGAPNEIYCDNGTNFHGAEHELRKVAMENSRLAAEQNYQNIKWHFNPPNAPHMGGAWERLIRSVKVALRCLQTERIPTAELMRTILTECEHMVNSRPLTYLETDENTLEALTPNHFLLGSSSGVKPFGNFTDDPEVLKREWKRQQAVTAAFWRRFVNEYLPMVSQRTKWFDKVRPLMVGDIVAIADSQAPGSWQLGRIIEVGISKDGNIRQATVKTAFGLFRRPASKLAVLIEEKLRDDGISSAGGSVADSAISEPKPSGK